MADTTALKNRIRAAVKANDNQEITGPVLQQALLDIVDELDLNPELENEAQQRQDADTQLGNLITGIKNNIDNGYVYAGIATPSTTPVSGKVFYLALTAGAYTNFGNTEVSQGINILKYNGSAWSLDAFIGIDDTPTPNSPKLVKSGGITKVISTQRLKGKGSTLVSSTLKLMKKRTYKLVLDNPSWLRNDTGTDDTQFIFGIESFVESTKQVLAVIYRYNDTGTASKYYDFVVPDNCDYIEVVGRANIGEEIVFNVYDITDIKNIENDIKERSKIFGLFLKGDGTNYVKKTYMGIIPGRTYIVSVNPIIWAHTQADTLPDKTSTGFRLYLENTDGSETNIVYKTIEQYNQVLSSYTFVAPENTKGTLVCICRADVGETISISVVEKFFESDIYEAQKKLEYAENISSNILCLETSTDNKFINSSGNIVNRDNRISDYIYCKGQQYISGSYKAGNNAFYDKDLKLLSAASQESGVVNIPQDAYYVRVTFSHYRNNDYFIFGNNPNLTTDDYVPYGTVINKENSKWADDRKNFENVNGNYAFSSFYYTHEHSSNDDRLYINIPAGSICTINVNAEKEIGVVRAACYVEYSDGEKVAIVSPLIDKNVFTKFSAAKDIVSIGFYVYAPSYEGRIYESVKISTDVDTEGLPLYWSNYIKTRMPDIHLQEEDTAFHGDMFIFFTDYHLEHNSGYSHHLMKYIVDRTHIDKIIFGGDAYNGSTTHAGALDKLRVMKERFAPLNVIGLRGNHEYNLNDGGSPEEMLTESEIFSNISDKTKATGVIRPSNDVMYGYLDNEEQKLRYIFLDSKYESGRHELIDDTQLNWMASKMTELDSSWTILIFSHQFRRKSSDAYMPSGQLIADKLASITYSATLAAVIYGHSHEDYYHSDLGYLDICTTCDSRQQAAHFDDYAGTVNEHAFDVYAINTVNRTIKAVRIGRYSDEVAIREWNY